jgi:predicted Zn-dependent protease
LTRVVASLVALLALACASEGPRYHHSRYDYWAFRSRVGLLPEPNYLPWVMHSEHLPDGARALVACRWADVDFPLRYRVAPPAISSEQQDEFNPVDPQEYVKAVTRALDRWQESIGPPVRFRPAGPGLEADFTVHLHADGHPESEVRVLGLVRDEKSHCEVLAPGRTVDQVDTRFAVRDVHLYIVDDVGLLAPNQVFTVALHEIGHLLGAAGQHSPLSGDVMFRIADDGRVDVLSEHDLNTFRSLYRLPPGSVYARIDDPHERPLPEVRRGPPRLDRRVVDERNDFAVSFPLGWQLIRSPHGWVGVDGVSWDHDASIQVLVLRGSLDEFLALQRFAAERRGAFVEASVAEVDGRRVATLISERGGRREELWFQDWGEGWVLVMIGDAPIEDHALYRSWFQLVYLSIDRAETEPLR